MLPWLNHFVDIRFITVG